VLYFICYICYICYICSMVYYLLLLVRITQKGCACLSRSPNSGSVLAVVVYYIWYRVSGMLCMLYM
jgi:hypothetical protein